MPHSQCLLPLHLLPKRPGPRASALDTCFRIRLSKRSQERRHALGPLGCAFHFVASILRLQGSAATGKNSLSVLGRLTTLREPKRDRAPELALKTPQWLQPQVSARRLMSLRHRASPRLSTRNPHDSAAAAGDTRPGEPRPRRGSQTGLVTSHQYPAQSDSERERSKDFERGEVEAIASIVVLPGHSESDEAEAVAWDGAD